MTGLLIAGTSSDAGKSLFVTGLCRVARRRGIDVAPFKAQNMSNNSMVCLDGSEIGRAQYLQAAAAGVVASSVHNPVLLKPGTDRRAFVVLRGRPFGALEAGEYATDRPHLSEAAYAAYEELASRHELVVCEGAGSPAEINLRQGDFVNLGLAARFDLPVATLEDLHWLRSTGIAQALVRRAAASRPVLGICGGFQMLARMIADPDGVENSGTVDGLSLLPVDVVFHRDKVLARREGRWRGEAVSGYEIHHGRAACGPGDEEFLDGVRVGSVWATMWHGSLESDGFRRAWLREVARQAGCVWSPSDDGVGFAAAREAMIETIADAIERHVEVDELLSLAR